MNSDRFDRNKYGWQINRPRALFPKGNSFSLSADQIFEKNKLERFLRNCALGVDIKLKKVFIDEVPEVEVFFDIFYDGKKVCYLLKQWNSSIMRLGDTIKLRRDSRDFKERFYKIHHICAVNYITLLFPPADKKDSSFQISLETPVYLDNFNERILEKAVNRFRKCKESLRPLLESKE